MALLRSDMHGKVLDSSASADSSGAMVIEATSAGPIVLPSGAFLSDATYLQQGGDLVLIGPDGATFVVRDYFLMDNPPDLVTPEGGRMTAALVQSFTPPEAAGQYAQAGPQVAQAAQPIGQVQDLAGQAFAIRADGTRVALRSGDPVFQGDVIETADDGAIGLLFVDETTFALGNSARLALDELVYNPATQQGQSSFSILKGVFVFVSGQIAQTDNTQMTVTTPVATIGIRGTKVAGDVKPAGEESKFTVVDGEIAIITQGGTVLMSQQYATTRVTSFQAPPSEPVILTQDQVESDYSSVGNIGGGLSPSDISPQAGGGAGGEDDVVSITRGALGIFNENGSLESDGEAEAEGPGDFGSLVANLASSDSDDPEELGDLVGDPVGEAEDDDEDDELGEGEGEGEGIPVTFDASGSNEPQTFVGSDSSEQIRGGEANDDLSGVGGNDVIEGNGGSDNIDGGSGNDTLTGGNGNDSVFGGAGDDTLIAASGEGNDTYNGGDGTDTAVFSSAVNSVTVNLATGTASGFDIDTDTLIGIENVIGGAGSDVITTAAGANSIAGGAGDDTIVGSTGTDIISGGAGTDTLSFSGTAEALTFDLAAGTVSDTASLESLFEPLILVNLPVDINTAGVEWEDLGDEAGFLAINDARSAAPDGTSDHFDDAMGVRVGGAAYTAPAQIDQNGNTFTGNVQTLGGLDVVVEFDFDGTLPVARQIVELTNNTGSTISTDVSWINNTGNDSGQLVIGSSSGDLLFGTDDRHLVTSDNLAGNFNEVNTWILYGPDSPAVTTSSVSLFDGEEVFGTSSDDGVRAEFDVSVGAGETQFLMWFVGINGNNQDGLDLTATFDDTENAQFLSLISDLPDAQLAATANWDFDTGVNTSFNGIESFVGGAGNDQFVGSSAADTFDGGAGDDTIFGNAGNDAILGSTGNDTIDGGAGFDVLTYDIAGLFIDFNAGTISGSGFLDTFTNVENVFVTVGNVNLLGSNNDETFSGSNLADTIDGGGGNDTITGFGGADILRGGAGNDTIVFDTADSDVDGGTGTDILRVETAGNTIDLAFDTSAVGNFEVIDLNPDGLGGTGNNTVSVDSIDILNSTENGTLSIVGDLTNTLLTSTDWIDGGTVNVGGVDFLQLTDSGATLLLDARIPFDTGVFNFLATVDDFWSTNANWSPSLQQPSDGEVAALNSGDTAIYDNTAGDGGITNLASFSGTDQLIINSGTLTASQPTSYDGNVVLNGGGFGGAGLIVLQNNFDVTGPADIVGAGGVTVEGAMTLGGTVTLASALTGSGVQTFLNGFEVQDSGGVMNALADNVATALDATVLLNTSFGNAGQLNITRSDFQTAGLVNIDGGTVNVGIAGGSQSVLRSTGGLSNDDTMSFDSSGSGEVGFTSLSVTGGQLVNNASGTLNFISDGFGSNEISATLFNLGTVRVDGAGTTSFINDALQTNLGLFDINGDTVIDLVEGNSFNTADGAVDVAGGSTLTITNGSFVVGNDTQLLGIGGIRIGSSSSFDVETGETFDLDSGTVEIELDNNANVGGAGTFTNSGFSDIIGVDISVDVDTFVNESGGTLQFADSTVTVDTPNFANDAGAIFELDGTPGNARATFNTNLTNNGLLHLTSDTNSQNAIVNFSGGHALTNSATGTILFDGLTNAINAVQGAFVNDGTVSVADATGNFGGAFTFTNNNLIQSAAGANFLLTTNNPGSFINAVGGTIDLNGGNMQTAFGTTTNDGVLNVNGGHMFVSDNGRFVQNPDLALGSGDNLTVGLSNSGGLMDGTGTLTIGSGAVVALGGNGTLSLDFTNDGIINSNGTLSNVLNISQGENFTGAAININNGTALTVQNGDLDNNAGGFINISDNGELVIDTGTLSNSGNIELGSGVASTTIRTQNGGVVRNEASGTVTSAAGSDAFFEIDAGTNQSRNLGDMVFNDAITFNFGVGATFTNEGTMDINNSPDGLTLDGDGTFTNELGATILIDGSGTVNTLNDAVFNDNGDTVFGASPGSLTINGNYLRGDTAFMEFELGGLAAGIHDGFDQLTVNGTMSAGGTMNVVEFGDFEVGVGDSFAIVQADTIVGSSAEISGLDVGGGVVLDATQSSSAITLTGRAVTHQGDSGDNTLTGGIGDDVVSAGDGNDVFTGNGGADLVHAGDGDDVFVASDTSFGRFDGGSGTDLLTLDGGGQTFDLTTLRGDQLSGIERIDFSGFGDNTLTLDTDMAFAATGNENTLTGEAHSLLIDGDNGDTLNAIGDWSNTGTVTIDGNGYSVYQNSANDAQIFVDDDIAVSAA